MKKRIEKVLSEVLGGLYAADKYLCEDLDAICDDTMREYAYGVLMKVRLAIQKAVECKDNLQLASNREMACELLKEEGFFYITSVHRDDLEAKDFDVSEVTDNEMEYLAKRMCGDYCTQMFHESMSILAECMGVPKKDKIDDEEE